VKIKHNTLLYIRKKGKDYIINIHQRRERTVLKPHDNNLQIYFIIIPNLKRITVQAQTIYLLGGLGFYMGTDFFFQWEL